MSESDWKARALAAEAALAHFAHMPDAWDALPDNARLLLTVLEPKRGWKFAGLPWRLTELRQAAAVMRKAVESDRAATGTTP
jgi:hypothetical protein